MTPEEIKQIIDEQIRQKTQPNSITPGILSDVLDTITEIEVEPEEKFLYLLQGGENEFEALAGRLLNQIFVVSTTGDIDFSCAELDIEQAPVNEKSFTLNKFFWEDTTLHFNGVNSDTTIAIFIYKIVEIGGR